MTDTIHYGSLMHDAMRGLIQRVLSDIETAGELPGDHHFFVTFDTRHPDADLPDWLRDRYPEEITVVIQHWFENLNVSDQGFGITLNFGDQPEALYIPYDAIRAFVDPSVEFGLQFEEQEIDIEEIPEVEPEDTPEDKPQQGEVVSLDAFRKN